MSHDYPINQHLAQLLNDSRATQANDQSDPKPPEPKPWMLSPVAAMTAPMFTGTHTEEKREHL